MTTEARRPEASMTVGEFIALNPAGRLKLAQALREAVTPEIVGLVIYTYLTTGMNPKVRNIYRKGLDELIARVNPIELVVAASRYVNTTTASSSLLPFHQEMFERLHSMQGGLLRRHIRRELWRGGREYMCGTLSRRILPQNIDELLKAGLKEGSAVLFDESKIRWGRDYQRGFVPMILVPMEPVLPETLGL